MFATQLGVNTSRGNNQETDEVRQNVDDDIKTNLVQQSVGLNVTQKDGETNVARTAGCHRYSLEDKGGRRVFRDKLIQWTYRQELTSVAVVPQALRVPRVWILQDV